MQKNTLHCQKDPLSLEANTMLIQLTVWLNGTLNLEVHLYSYLKFLDLVSSYSANCITLKTAKLNRVFGKKPYGVLAVLSAIWWNIWVSGWVFQMIWDMMLTEIYEILEQAK